MKNFEEWPERCEAEMDPNYESLVMKWKGELAYRNYAFHDANTLCNPDFDKTLDELLFVLESLSDKLLHNENTWIQNVYKITNNNYEVVGLCVKISDNYYNINIDMDKKSSKDMNFIIDYANVSTEQKSEKTIKTELETLKRFESFANNGAILRAIEKHTNALGIADEKTVE